MFAIVDCNSFYCSCERLFRPDLANRPVVVLSNNDGCIISRTDEAKALGIQMAAPYWEQKDVIQERGVTVFSSNYPLYGDMSMRVMDCLRFLAGGGATDRVEVYSVDEAFINLSGMPADQLDAYACRVRDTVAEWTGIRVSVGVAPSKLLSKVANKLAKKDKQRSGCVMVLDSDEKVREALERMPVGELWGVGHQYGTRLRDYYGILNGWQLAQMPEAWARKHLGGVVGERLIRELRGEPCIPMKDPLRKKEQLATTRMFGKPVFDLVPLKEAVATFTARAAEKLRRQFSAATTIDVFVVVNGSHGTLYDYNPQTHHRYRILSQPTSITQDLLRAALPLVEQLYRPGPKYLKAGVILGGIVPEQAIQGSLFCGPPEATKRDADATADPAVRNKALMEAMDNINFSMRDDAVKFLASGLTRNWKMRQERRSGRYTTRWEELHKVN
jgi:DNA polymerase V